MIFRICSELKNCRVLNKTESILVRKIHLSTMETLAWYWYTVQGQTTLNVPSVDLHPLVNKVFARGHELLKQFSLNFC